MISHHRISSNLTPQASSLKSFSPTQSSPSSPPPPPPPPPAESSQSPGPAPAEPPPTPPNPPPPPSPSPDAPSPVHPAHRLQTQNAATGPPATRSSSRIPL